MSTLTAIKEQIKTILAAIDEVGNVYDYLIFTTSVLDLKELFSFTPQGEGDAHLRGWTITRTSTEEEWLGTEMNFRKHEFIIRGYMSFGKKGHTEQTWQDLVELVCDAFRPKFDLNNTDSITFAMQAEEVGHTEFAGVICHYAELSLVAEVAETYTVA